MSPEEWFHQRWPHSNQGTCGNITWHGKRNFADRLDEGSWDERLSWDIQMRLVWPQRSLWERAQKVKVKVSPGVVVVEAKVRERKRGGWEVRGRKGGKVNIYKLCLYERKREERERGELHVLNCAAVFPGGEEGAKNHGCRMQVNSSSWARQGNRSSLRASWRNATLPTPPC